MPKCGIQMKEKFEDTWCDGQTQSGIYYIDLGVENDDIYKFMKLKIVSIVI